MMTVQTFSAKNTRFKAGWILPVGMALPASSDPTIAPIYYTMAGLLILGQLVTVRNFFFEAR
jgi:hypothetical protein